MKATVELFYLGDHFYIASHTMMGCLYTVDTLVRYDWGFVARDLELGKEVKIRPATAAEVAWATRLYAVRYLEGKEKEVTNE